MQIPRCEQISSNNLHVRRYMGEDLWYKREICKLQIKHLNIHKKVEVFVRNDNNPLFFLLFLNPQSSCKKKR